MLKDIFHVLSKKQKKNFLFILLLVIAGTLIETLSIGLIVPVMSIMQHSLVEIQNINYLKDILIYLNGFGIIFESKSQLLITFLLFFFGVYFFKLITLLFIAWQNNKFIYAVQQTLTLNLFTAFAASKYAFFSNLKSNDLLRNLTNNSEIFINTLIIPCLVLLTEIFVIFALTLLMFILQPEAAILAFTFFLIVTYIFYIFSKNKMVLWGTVQNDNRSSQIKTIQDLVNSFQLTKSFQIKDYYLDKYNLATSNIKNTSIKQKTLTDFPRLGLEFLAITTFCILITVMLKLSKGNVFQLLPILGYFAASAFRILPSMNRVITSLQALKFGKRAVHDYKNQLKYFLLQKEPKLLKNFKKLKLNKLEFKKISFSYPSSSRQIIKNLSFKINKGEILGISGDSGIGKTTLAEIILGLQNPSTGKILLNNKKTNLTTSNFRNIISYIPQKTFLFDATIDENITLFEKSVDYKKLNLIKKICNINFEKKGKNSFVGETGNKLSGGQIQRIGVARGLYRNHSILILDEPTSSLDKSNENLIIKNILKFKKNKTLIIISHNPKILSFCNRRIRI